MKAILIAATAPDCCHAGFSMCYRFGEAQLSKCEKSHERFLRFLSWLGCFAAALRAWCADDFSFLLQALTPFVTRARDGTGRHFKDAHRTRNGAGLPDVANGWHVEHR
jgi:hypothetical protein